MPTLNEFAGSLVARKRERELGTYRDAYETTGISIGTWERIEKGGAFQPRSLRRVVEELGWPTTAASELLRGLDPDAPPAEAQVLFPGHYADREEPEREKALARMESWPRHLVAELGRHGRYLTDVEKEEFVVEVKRIADSRRVPRRHRDEVADEMAVPTSRPPLRREPPAAESAG